MKLKQLLARVFRPREYWVYRADKLNQSRDDNSWYVGRTDLQTYTDYGYTYYAYPPVIVTKAAGFKPQDHRVAFYGSRTSALRKAVKYAERMNRRITKAVCRLD